MKNSSESRLVETRFYILSDTHGIEFDERHKFCQKVDVAIHCGDLTEESKLEEYRTSLRLLQSIQAPLKLVIAGNHDFTLDEPIFEGKVANARPPLDIDLVKQLYGDYGEARQLFENAKSAGIIFLDEGNHQFKLNNGALLTVYASPSTPSLGDWSFQYTRSQGHDFEITQGVDLVLTHGPPKGIMDYTESRQRAGCSDLFVAVARARPRLHCFGHIHEGWGAKVVTWREQPTENPSHFTDIDNDKSTVIERLSGLNHSILDTDEIKEEKAKKEKYHLQQRCYATSHCAGDALSMEYGAQPLFVNAAIKSIEEGKVQLPWLVEIELPKAA